MGHGQDKGMDQLYLDARGWLISVDKLSVSKAMDTANVLHAGIPFVTLLETRRLDTPAADIVVFEVEVELGQVRVNDIRPQERIAVIFHANDELMPDALALRADFPEVPHLNLRIEEFPRSLCLYEEPYSEIKLKWTPKRFIERIREWLARTATGQLHTDDQPLEPLLPISPWSLVLPDDLFTGNQFDDFEALSIDVVDGGDNQYTLIARKREPIASQRGEKVYIATAFAAAPQEHGIIYKYPSNLLELHLFLARAQLDFLAELRHRLKGWRDKAHRQDGQLIVIVALPKTRNGTGEVEAQDLRAFLCSRTVREVGADIGIWQIQRGQIAALLETDIDKQGEQVELSLLNPMFAFSPQLAAAYNGQFEPAKTPITAVGVGALGSQVFSNLTRMGFGRWTLIDKDIVDSHNFARHALYGFALGQPKAIWMATLANRMLNDDQFAKAIVTDVLAPGNKQREVDVALEGAHVILDMSASFPVARHIALESTADARRISVFLNPTGTDLVLLAEDVLRRTPLDSLEMQYYRHVINSPSLGQHLRPSDDRLRYAQSCRDVSSTLPQDFVALHAAIGSRAIRGVLSDRSAKMIIWQYGEAAMSLTTLDISVAAMIEYRFGAWTLRTDHGLLEKIGLARADKLPNETGGVLLGTVDVHHRIVYVVDLICSPPDSMEWPTSYIRGSRGLSSQIVEAERRTARMVDYVGEWHSHPPGYDCTASIDDRTAFQWLTEQMSNDGLPPLMMIVGDEGQVGVYLDQMVD